MYIDMAFKSCIYISLEEKVHSRSGDTNISLEEIYLYIW